MFKKIFEYLSTNPTLVNLIVILIITIGIISTVNLKQEVFPPTDIDTMIVNVAYPGASPQDVEINVVIPMEEKIKKIVGIKEYVSLSLENNARIYIYLDEDLSNKQKVKDEITRNLNSVPDLPQDIEDIKITEVNPKMMSVYTFAIMPKKNSGVSKSALFKFADKVEKKLLKLNGVGEVRIEGYEEPEVKIYVNPNKMKNYYISLNDVLESIQSRNIRSTGGSIQSVQKEQTIVTIGQFDDPLDVKDVIIRSSYEQNRVHIRDIAKVEMGFKEDNIELRVNKNNAVSISIVKKENADIMKTIKNVKSFLNKISKESLSEKFEIVPIDDRSLSIRSLLKVVLSNAIIGFILVFIMLFLFLDVRSAFWTAFGIPITILITLSYMFANDISINLMSLGAIITVLGILVDDAIIISENIFTHRKEGLPPLQAGVQGLLEVLGPVTISVITTIFAFLPLLAVKGKMGKFIMIFPILITVALLASLFESIFLLPNHLVHGKIKQKAKKDWFAPIIEKYSLLLKKILKFRYLVLIFFMILLVLTFFLSKSSFGRFKLIIDNSSDTVLINLEAPESSSLSQTSKLTSKIEDIVLNVVKKEERVAINTVIGHHRVKKLSDKGNHTNWSQVAIYLKPYTDRERTAGEIIRALKKAIKEKKVKGFKKILFTKKVLGPDPGQGVDIKVTGNDDRTNIEVVEMIESFLKTIPGVTDLDNDNKPGKEELKIVFNYQKLAQFNMNVATVAQTIRTAFEGTIATSIQMTDKKLDFRVEIDSNFKENKNFLKNLLIPNKQGNLIRLEEIAGIKIQEGSSTITRFNGERTITINANIDKKTTTSKNVMGTVKRHFKDISKTYPDISLIFGGEAQETEKSLRDLFIAMLLAILGIYTVLVFLFKNSTQPLLVLMVVPFGMIGALLAFYFHKMPLSFMGLVGMIGLTGVVVNDSVVMVDFINKVIRKNNNKLKLIDNIASGAKKRLRPVLLTTLTTVFGLLPTVYGIGGKAESIVPTVMAIAYGLIFATLLTLFFIPSLFMIGTDVRSIKNGLFKLKSKN